MRVHFVIHEDFEAPAAIETWAVKRGFDITYSRLHAGDSLPSAPAFDLLVVMGGPQSPATTTDECPHFDSATEAGFIRAAINQNKTVLGVCLGAQMIGEALGARYEHSPNREIGVFPITLTDEGKADAIIGKFPGTFRVGHWHGDMPGLTSDAAVLATSVGCPRQIVRYTPKVYGFQCHFEFTTQCVEGLIENDAEALREFAALPFVESPEVLRAHDYNEMNVLLEQFLDDLIEI